MPRGEEHRIAAFHPQCFQCALMLPDPIIPILRLEVVATWAKTGPIDVANDRVGTAIVTIK